MTVHDVFAHVDLHLSWTSGTLKKISDETHCVSSFCGVPMIPQDNETDGPGAVDEVDELIAVEEASVANVVSFEE